MSSERPKEVTARHLNGEAAVYVRQSSKKQDEENKGSFEYQRGQARHARSWGFSEIKIRFYEDRGLSGSASEHRPNLLEMLEGIKIGRITAVFASDQSRIARNAIEWFKFLNLCGDFCILLVLDGRIVNLGDGGDGLSSRVMALVDEFDLEKRRGHILRGITGRLDDEKAVTAPPTGYVSLKEEKKGEWDLDPDHEVQAAITAIFRIFLEERSCARTVRRLVAEGMRVPARKPGKSLRWVDPDIIAVRRFLKNPAYCGDYVYRQRVCDRTRGKNKFGQWRVRVATKDERREIHDHHAGYITREVFEEIQQILRANAPSKLRRNLGPGAALVQGILRCGKHDERSMSVDYKEALRDGRTGAHYYHCLGLYEVGGPQCGAIPGRPLDLAVAQAAFLRLSRPPLEVLRAEWDRSRKGEIGAKRGRQIALDQAQRRVNDLRARMMMISPELRELAEDFEIQLDEALGDLKHAKAVLSSVTPETELFTEDVFDELMNLCEDLPALFYAATTTHRDRKEILRTVIDRVVVTGRNPEVIAATIYWADGSEPTPVQAPLMRFAHRVIRELAEEGYGNLEIARRVNEMGLATSRGKPWTRETVWVVRFKNGRRGKSGTEGR